MIVTIAGMLEKVMCSLRSQNQRSLAMYLNIRSRLVARLRNEKCKSKHTFWGQTITDEQFGQTSIKDLNNKFSNWSYWICEGLFQYFSR